MQRSSSLPGSSLTTQSSVIPDTQISTPPDDVPFPDFSSHISAQTSQALEQQQEEHIIESSENEEGILNM